MHAAQNFYDFFFRKHNTSEMSISTMYRAHITRYYLCSYIVCSKRYIRASHNLFILQIVAFSMAHIYNKLYIIVARCIICEHELKHGKNHLNIEH